MKNSEIGNTAIYRNFDSVKDYFKQIDALRCYAVIGVMIVHIYPDSLPKFDFLIRLYHYLPGVPVFFCISGFLITLILIKNNLISDRKKVLKSFYLRRFLRIFPIYYLTIFLLFIINPENYREWFVYDLFYVTNINQAIDGSFGSSIAPHFWSLSVEEQFYLFWPLLLSFGKSLRLYLFLILSIFMIGFIALLYDPNSFWINRTIGNLAFLGAGAFLSFLWINHKSMIGKNEKSLNALLAGFFLFIATQSILDFSINNRVFILIEVVVIAALTLKFATGFTIPIMKRIFENSLVIYIGKISYGIYIFHILAIYPAILAKKTFHLDFLNNEVNMFFFKFILTIIISALSWEFFEKRINKLKEKFSY